MKDVLYQKSAKLSKIFIMNIVAGIGWAVGISFGFALLIAILTAVFTYLGGLPVIGNWFADLLLTIQQSVDKKLL